MLQVDNVNLVAGPKNVLVHFGVPESCLVSKVRTCLQQVTHTYLRHNSTLCLGFTSVSPAAPTNYVGTRVRNCEETCYLPVWLSLSSAQRRALYHSPASSKSGPHLMPRVGYTARLSINPT